PAGFGDWFYKVLGLVFPAGLEGKYGGLVPAPPNGGGASPFIGGGPPLLAACAGGEGETSPSVGGGNPSNWHLSHFLAFSDLLPLADILGFFSSFLDSLEQFRDVPAISWHSRTSLPFLDFRRAVSEQSRVSSPFIDMLAYLRHLLTSPSGS
ncbi:hypothetical protein Taro_026741, partial [Colocasia esculenta]|nr:hypothetical protein [Colocasia esculenta]